MCVGKQNKTEFVNSSQHNKHHSFYSFTLSYLRGRQKEAQESLFWLPCGKPGKFCYVTSIIKISENKSTIPIGKWTEIFNTNLTSMIVDLRKVKGEYSRIKLAQLVLEVLSLTLPNCRQLRYIETPINTNLNILVLFCERIKLENHKLYPKFISNGKLYRRRY